MEQARPNQFDCVGGTVREAAKTEYRLVTGGKGGSQRRNLFQLTCPVQAHAALPSWFNFSAEHDVPPEKIELLGKHLGHDGNLWVALPDNAERDITPYIPGENYYWFQAGQQKYHLFIQANGHTLKRDEVVPSAKYAIGEKINLSPIFVPGLPEEPQKNPIQWALGGTYINAFKVWLFDHEGIGLSPHDNAEGLYDSAQGLTDFRVDPSRLHQENTFAWWQTGSTTDFKPENISLGMGLTFANGQYVVVTAKGQIGMHQPTVSWNRMASKSGMVNGQAVGPFCWIGLIEDPTHTQGPIIVAANSQSLVSGRFGITQLVKRNCFIPTGSWSDWQLDGSMPYDTGDHRANTLYVFGSAESELGDAPSVFGYSIAWSQDQFTDYFMFRPTDAIGNPLAGSIWTTLGTTEWNWYGSIAWSLTDPKGWVWMDDPVFFWQQAITPSHQHPEFEKTH